jgi:hypothetical protein
MWILMGFGPIHPQIAARQKALLPSMCKFHGAVNRLFVTAVLA